MNPVTLNPYSIKLAPCGCQLQTFRCTTCKKKFTLRPHPVNPMHPVYPPTYYRTVTYWKPTSLPFLHGYKAAVSHRRYYNFQGCSPADSFFDVKISERSFLCPKNVGHCNKYICRICIWRSIHDLCGLKSFFRKKTISPKVDTSLQRLLELSIT